MRRLLLLLAACSPATSPPEETGDTVADSPTDTPVPTSVPWDPRLPSASTLAPPRGWVARRAVVHLHSPWSHDACDGTGPVDGQRDEACMADLQDGLCATRYDVAFVTDHPDYGDAQPFDQLLPAPPGAERVDDDGHLATLLSCDDGHTVQLRAGFEDELMPVGLTRHVDEDPTVRHDLLNREDADAIAAMRAAGAQVFSNHPELRTVDNLRELRDRGVTGMEIYNLHAMFAPNIRKDALGMGSEWIGGVGPFIAGNAAPDLVFLSVHEAQRVTLDRFDALLADGPMVGVGGTDAHQNIPLGDLPDGERADSYRRMLRWFSTMLLARDAGVASADEALGAGRAYVAFEVLGTPVGFDLHGAHADGVTEMGGVGPAGELVVACPSLHPEAPREEAEPEVRVRVYRDGAVWQEACGRFDAGPGVYRVEVDVVPHHLAGWLEGAPELATRAYPWILSNAVRLE